MNRSILTLLLGLSIIFNVFFIVGARTWRPSDLEQTDVKEVADVLALDTRQTDVFRSMRQEFKTEVAVLSQQIHRVRSMIAEELASEQPDTTRLRMLTEQETALQAERHAVSTSQFTEFIGMLSPSQRRQLGRRLMGPHDMGHPPRELERMAIERFDLDGDGLLDEEERKAAREFSRQMHKSRKAHRRELEKRFDLDGDGRLSPDEQEALREHLLEQRSRRSGDQRNRGHRPPTPDRPGMPTQEDPPLDRFPPGID